MPMIIRRVRAGELTMLTTAEELNRLSLVASAMERSECERETGVAGRCRAVLTAFDSAHGSSTPELS